jgi:hypothetical protein
VRKSGLLYGMMLQGFTGIEKGLPFPQAPLLSMFTVFNGDPGFRRGALCSRRCIVGFPAHPKQVIDLTMEDVKHDDATEVS